MKAHRLDLDIKNDILAELKWTPDVKETDIGVIVKDGAVTLTGTVPFYSDRYAAARAAKRINGVRALVNNIQVKTAFQKAGTSQDIAEHLARLFEWDTQIPDDYIRADVEGGIVALSGEVE